MVVHFNTPVCLISFLWFRLVHVKFPSFDNVKRIAFFSLFDQRFSGGLKVKKM